MLQREINITVRKDFIEASSYWAGTSGDHKSTVLVFYIQEEGLVNSEYAYKLQLNDEFALLELEGDKLRFELPQAVLFEKDFLQVQLTISHGEEQVYVSDILDFHISPNLCSEPVEIKYDGLLNDSVENFNSAVKEFEKMCDNFPYVDKTTLTWWVFDGKTDKYVDTKISAGWGEGDMPAGFIKPENLSFFEHVLTYTQVLPLCTKFMGGVNDYGNIDEAIFGYYTYLLDNYHVGEDIIHTQYCHEAVYVNSGSVTRKSLDTGDSDINTYSAYTKLYIVVSFENDSKAAAWYENNGKVDKYIFTDEGFKKAIINCVNEK